EIAHACISSAEAGAAICHVHVRELDTARPSMNLEYYREVMKRIADDVAAEGAVESFPRLDGRNMIMVVAPNK
ncbi:MAG: 3-keto-5-aminohexanoate cleavage protein, partial [Myxococcota bacterium]